MANNKFKSPNEQGVNILDLFFYLLSYWYWFLLSIIVCVGFVAYKYATSDFVYRADATVIIKDPSNTKSAARLDNYNNLINRTNVTNEILQFRSKNLMTEVVKRLDANVSYKVKARLRMNELYSETPVRVKFLDKYVAPSTLVVTAKEGERAEVNFGSRKEVISFGDTVSTSAGKIVSIVKSLSSFSSSSSSSFSSSDLLSSDLLSSCSV